jgi:hypothetical protein
MIPLATATAAMNSIPLALGATTGQAGGGAFTVVGLQLQIFHST